MVSLNKSVAIGEPYKPANTSKPSPVPAKSTESPAGSPTPPVGYKTQNLPAKQQGSQGDSFTPRNNLFMNTADCGSKGGPLEQTGGSPFKLPPSSKTTTNGQPDSSYKPTEQNVPGTPPVKAATDKTTPSGSKIELFGGSQSGENNIDFSNPGDDDMLVYVQKNLEKGEADPGGTVFRVPKGSKMTVSAIDNVGLRFQVFNGQLTPEQEAQLAKGGTVSGVAKAPGQTDTLYETNYVAKDHLSYDDISPLDGAKTPMKVEGINGRTMNFSKEVIDGAPVHNPDGSIPGLGPSASPYNNDALLPALRDYYARMSLRPDGTRDFYYNSSDSGGADKAMVSYTGSPGTSRTTVTLG